MHQESLRSFPEFSVSGFPTRTQKCISLGCSLIQRLKWGKIHCQAGVVALDFLRAVALGSHFLTSHCPKTACSSLPDCPLHRARLQKRVKEDVNKREVIVFHHLVLEMLSHYFAYSLNLSRYICLRGGGYTGHGYWEVGIIQNHLTSSLPFMLYSIYFSPWPLKICTFIIPFLRVKKQA